ncbi:MAG: bifunctional DNA-formamidopyrimidine glycosylase/DNA-(apurinic or apyrimidinic site) lyase [Verrucomicrobiota bacterium]|nr:bifunctional DNA-formamidopyrimidine glycosylase/DNA-(apurinic or apyrimidinic site) lyase [Verrucomicrobiota bacterium]
MPELPEVEVLRCHLDSLLVDKKLVSVDVLKLRVVRPELQKSLQEKIVGCTIKGVGRKGKFLWLQLERRQPESTFPLIIHLGMTGRLFIRKSNKSLPKHAAVVFKLNREYLVFKDPRSFGRVTFDVDCLENLGVDALSSDLTEEILASVIQNTSQSVKARLMNQKHIAGLGNIYSCEVLHKSKISPFIKGSSLCLAKVKELRKAINVTLHNQVNFGLSLKLDFEGEFKNDGLFYYGTKSVRDNQLKEPFRVYGREGEPCRNCGSIIMRSYQANRSTYYCPECQLCDET